LPDEASAKSGERGMEGRRLGREEEEREEEERVLRNREG